MTLPLAERRLYLCVGLRERLEAFVESCLDGGVDVVQLRDKHADGRALLEAATSLAARCRERGVPFVVNDRPDLALAAGADGVHVGQDDLPVRWCRAVLGPSAIVGLSTHAPSELDAAIDEDASYLSAGPISPTPTKPGRPGTGVGYALEATRRSRVPVFVTGGVTPTNVGELVAAGLRHFVVVRALTEATDPRRTASDLRAAIDDALAAAAPAGGSG